MILAHVTGLGDDVMKCGPDVEHKTAKKLRQRFAYIYVIGIKVTSSQTGQL